MVSQKAAWLVWRLPEALFILGIFWRGARFWLWVPSLTVAGLACTVNPRRCGRRHCFATGPLFLLGAVATLLQGLEIVAIHWSWIVAAMLLGTAGAYAFECIYGKYAENG
jgi:hypothetical protein